MMLRPSGINLYLKCEAKYYFQVIEGVKTPAKVAPAFGTAIHETIKTIYTEKLISGELMQTEAVKDLFHDTAVKQFAEVDSSDFATEPAGKWIDSGIELIEKYRTDVAPKVQPDKIEQKLEVKFKGIDYGITGTVDLIDKFGTIIDHKTSSKDVTKVNPDYQRQVSAYHVLAQANNNKVRGARIDYLIRRSKDNFVPRTRHFNVHTDVKEFLTTLQNVGDAITKGVFIQRRDSPLCTKRYCQFWEVCEKKYGGTVKP